MVTKSIKEYSTILVFSCNQVDSCFNCFDIFFFLGFITSCLVTTYEETARIHLDYTFHEYVFQQLINSCLNSLLGIFREGLK